MQSFQKWGVGSMLMASALLVLGIGCSSNTSSSTTEVGDGPACNIDAECGRGKVCLGGQCGVKNCQALSDCATNQLCTASPTGGSVCTGRECVTDAECDGGGTCTSGLCSGGTTPTGCSKDADCEADEACDTTTGKCETKTGATPTGLCAACTDNEGCDTGLECGTVGPSKHCVKACTDNAGCDSGWTCDKGYCVPGLFQCNGCLVNNDCEAGQHCNANTGTCMATPAASCEPCTYDGDCGPGNRCHGKAVTRYCVPECGDGTCPGNGTCETLEGGAKVCTWNTSGPCCFGDAATCGGGNPCDACGGATPHCDVNMACVACTENSHCADPTPICDGGTCVEEGQVMCSGATPHYSEPKGKCCECLNASHCNGLACDSVNCECTENSGTVCDTCVEPYPACAEFEGQFVCVQCASDADCKDTCDTASFTCSGNEVPASGNCVEDGCDLATLTCDTDTGLCFDPAGNCDTVAQFCTNGGACIDFISTFTECLGGGGGGLPFPTDGGLPGNCECELAAGELPGFGQGNCPDGLTCGPNGLALLFCGLTGAEVPNVCQPPFEF